MFTPKILLGSESDIVIQICNKVAADLGIIIYVENKIEDFLLAIYEKNNNALILDIDLNNIETVKIIRLIRYMRPKIPLITLGGSIGKYLGGKILSEGVFRLMISPPSKESLSITLMSALI